jgi:hypothetical protein
MKTVTKTVQLFEKGELARVKKGVTLKNCRYGDYKAGDIIYIVKQDDDDEIKCQKNPHLNGLDLNDEGDVDWDFTVHESELEPMTAAETAKIMADVPSSLKVDSLEPTIVVGKKDGKVHVGCQTLTWKDARKVGEFLLANVPVRRSKKVSKKRGRK